LGKRKEKTMRNGKRLSWAALLAMGGIVLLSSCVQVNFPAITQLTLSQQVVSEYKTSLNTSAGRDLGRSTTSSLSAAQVDTLTSAAQAAIDAAGLHDSKALDKIVTALVQSVATQVVSASTAAAPVDLSAALIVASKSAVVSMGRVGRESSITAGLTTATAIAQVTAKMVDIVNTTITDANLRAAAKTGIVTEAISALDLAATVSATDVSTAVTAIVKQVATQEAGDDVSFKAIMAAASAGATTLTKVNSATIAPEMATAAVEGIKAVAADTTKTMTAGQTDALISAVASQISTGDATVDAAITNAITTKLADTSAGAAALSTSVNVLAVVSEAFPAVTATARVGDSGLPSVSVSIGALGRVWLLATPSSGAAVTSWTRTSLGPEPIKDSASGNWYIDPISSGIFSYKVIVTNTSGVKTAGAQVTVTSTIATITLPAVPAAPIGFAVVAGDAQTTISWKAASDATSYRLYFSTSSGVTPSSGTRLTISSGTSFTQTGLLNGTTYYYILTSVNAGGESTASMEVSAMPQIPVLMPTVANLTGSWKGPGMTIVSSSTSNGVTTSSTITSINTYTFAPDSTWSVFSVYLSTPIGGGAATTSYIESRGTYATSGNEITMTTTDTRTLSSATDVTTVWSTTAYTRTFPMVLYGGKLYGIVPGTLLAAQGSPSGLVGTWVSAFSSSPGSFAKVEVTFGSNGSVTSSFYSSPTSTFTTPPSTELRTYTTGPGTFTIAMPGTPDQVMYYSLPGGSYLTMGPDATQGAYEKQ
jgi:hypothetical protein